MNKFFTILFLLFLNANLFGGADTVNNTLKRTRLTNQDSGPVTEISKSKEEKSKSHARFLPFYTAPLLIIIIVLAAKRRRKKQNDIR
ncbi:MAG TPA: hypothetical protein VD905_09805 [Flavobacteriales bacterium]|nr:hypothetical protein [Flavobacteriales bacterium]